jgi:hypothetical protein
MNTKILVFVLLGGLLTVNSCLAVTSIALPGAAPAPHVTPKVQSVMSMGKLDAIDLAAKTFHINGVAYSFEGSGVRFVNTNGGAMQAAQLKAGDWVQFWIKPATAQRMPQVERVVLMVNPESRKTKP